MNIDKEALVRTYREFEESLGFYDLPTWNELPDIPLYMDQVITLVSKYLEIYRKTLGTETILTPSMINNYVKLGTIPAPVKKKYTKVHIAYLLVVCTLKQTLDMATIHKLMPCEMPENYIENFYNSFVENQKKAFVYVTQKITDVANPIFSLEGDNQTRLNDLVMQVSASANICKILTEKLCACEAAAQEN